MGADQYFFSKRLDIADQHSFADQHSADEPSFADQYSAFSEHSGSEHSGSEHSGVQHQRGVNPGAGHDAGT
jgi:hypothetical protein